MLALAMLRIHPVCLAALGLAIAAVILPPSAFTASLDSPMPTRSHRNPALAAEAGIFDLPGRMNA
jgi:hypothetical protein